MHSTLQQDTRAAKLTTALGDKLAIVRFDGTEGMSELFEYRIEALSSDEVNYDDLLGKPCTITLKAYGQERHFHAIVVEAKWIGWRQENHVHLLVARPWLWLCSRWSDCKIYQKKTAPDIIQEVFRNRGFSDYRLNLQENHPKRDYCVQYRETDLAFVSRLMEEEGIFYFFEHSADKHTLVLGDSSSANQPVPGLASVDFIALGTAERRDRQHIYQWVSERRVRTRKVELNDYYELTSTADLKANRDASAGHRGSEFYDYPGRYTNRGDGRQYAKVVLDAEQALDDRRHVMGNAFSLFPGGTTNVQEHVRSKENQEYVVVRASHLYADEHYRSGSGMPDEDYAGTFEFLPKKADSPFRAPILTPKPHIYGIQTAVVTGPRGEEIYTDEYGRIKVQFHWDRYGKKDENSSCWIRVVEPWAGKQWGCQHTPRIGMEVVIEFIEGDPDRPVVVGTVYNDQYKHPFKLEANKSQSGIKSNSTIGGGGYNQVMFEDKKNNEQIDLHAQKHYKLTILDTETRDIGQSFTGSIAGPNSRKTTLLQGDDELMIASGNQTITIVKNQSTTIAQSRTTTIGQSDTLAVGQSITIAAGSSITLVCGGSIINMTPSSINIVSSTINMAAGAMNVLAPLQVAPTITAPLVNGRP